MSVNPLERLLRPKSIAVIGGGAYAPNVVVQSLKMGFAGEVWPVHPRRTGIEGVRAYASLAELPGAPDAVFIGVNRFATIGIVRELAAMGAGGAICFASGFLEAGEDEGEGARLQRELIAAAGDMPVIGPNCYGLINYADGALLWPDQHGGRRLKPGERGAAIITQSSNIAINLSMQQRGLPVAYLMTAGNQAQTGLSDMALGLIEDERVSCLGLHIEGFDSVSGFERLAARARELAKPIIAMKVGRSEQARAATISHTASLAGSDAGSEAFLRRLGIARVGSIPSLLEALKLVHVHGPLPGRRLSSMSCSGGEASVIADAAVGRGVGFPALSAGHRQRVRDVLGPLVAPANPLDYHTFIWNDGPAMQAAFGIFVQGGFDLDMLVLDYPRADRCSDADWATASAAFEAALKANDARGAIVATMPENLPEHHAEQLIERGIVPLHGIAEALEAAEAAAFIGEAWAKPAPEKVFAAGVDGTRHAQATVPDEAEAKSRLAAAGLPVPAGLRASAVEEAVAAAERLGFPVALKALGVGHKSELDAVKLNLKSGEEVRAQAEKLVVTGQGLYVERMVSGAVAELIVGVTRDPVFGPVMTLGSGGVLVELLRDSTTLLLPATPAEIEAGLRSLRLFPLLDGYRGRAKADLGAAVDAIHALAGYVLDHAQEIEELDINPLIVCEQGRGAWIADALLVVRPAPVAVPDKEEALCPMS
ncbi:acetate--CoA ligase family protein [Aquamicrobium defluvii]|uniref:Acyl-CoA synthetase n=1 Tax=Aquamicrobium defluvii TaxID=69279 RepID=A0A011UTQ7_9HYPH|nr:acetate--CoA ligase family protein [Aquamicrobium defluvii]EXL09273.1 acyl-CoA synthetase [Aquamicrobium defluvii]EZQ15437.1 acyl-CoA synthetase [Halopseudomonas bauzanensis]TDR36107.1 acyl-CoA synthetase (NDP forming) [Aquamicrobium defluvii]